MRTFGRRNKGRVEGEGEPSPAPPHAAASARAHLSSPPPYAPPPPAAGEPAAQPSESRRHAHHLWDSSLSDSLCLSLYHSHRLQRPGRVALSAWAAASRLGVTPGLRVKLIERCGDGVGDQGAEEAIWGLPRENFHVRFGGRLSRASRSPFSALSALSAWG